MAQILYSVDEANAPGLPVGALPQAVYGREFPAPLLHAPATEDAILEYGDGLYTCSRVPMLAFPVLVLEEYFLVVVVVSPHGGGTLRRSTCSVKMWMTLDPSR